MKITLLVSYLFSITAGFTQDSLWYKQENTVIVTATRTNTSKNIVTTPVLVISKKQIQQSGAIKLNDILQEQVGIIITNGSGSRAVGGGIFGNGIQMQGLSPDHILILIDGEPIIGRQGGSIDLTRIAVGNIKQIEVIKGPFSSLYGSEAMGGVVNVITENPLQNNWSNSIRYGSFNTLDVQSKAFIKNKKLQTLLFANYYKSDGYDLNKNDIEKTADANNNFTAQAKVSYQINDKYKLTNNARLLVANQLSNFAINSNIINIGGNALTNDLSNAIKLEGVNNAKRKNVTTLVFNNYSFVQKLDSLKNNKSYYNDNFAQNLIRTEHIESIQLQPNATLQTGIGFTSQSIKTERYNGKQVQNALHAFVQQDYACKITPLIVSAGIRYDYNTDFKASINPKLALSYKINPFWKIRASVGSGFKAPDFRQLYLNFINNAADNYIIYGTQEFSLATLQQQLANGFIAQIQPAAYQIKKLLPEQSIGYNWSINGAIHKNVLLETQLFYNDVKNLIQYIEVAKRNNGAIVYSYANIQNAFTLGGETTLQWQLNKHFNVTGAYQFLKSGDKAIVKNLQSNTVYGRDAIGGSAKLLTVNDYKNLQNRSTHTAQAKLSFQKNKWSSALRCIYRGRWGTFDYDGNAFANMDAEYAKSYLQLNWSGTIQVNKSFTTTIGVNNITNYKDAINVANLMPINGFISIQYQLNKNKK
jgi:outer membrane receptor for ferrienterochelin and colicins